MCELEDARNRVLSIVAEYEAIGRVSEAQSHLPFDSHPEVKETNSRLARVLAAGREAWARYLKATGGQPEPDVQKQVREKAILFET